MIFCNKLIPKIIETAGNFPTTFCCHTKNFPRITTMLWKEAKEKRTKRGKYQKHAVTKHKKMLTKSWLGAFSVSQSCNRKQFFKDGLRGNIFYWSQLILHKTCQKVLIPLKKTSCCTFSQFFYSKICFQN